MAVTSIWRVKGQLDKVVRYVKNPDKTDNPAFGNTALSQPQDLSGVIQYAMQERKTGQIQTDDEGRELLRQFVSGVNCHPSTARDEMISVKKRFGKEGGTIAYHGYQSFAPGEATPEIAHEIGVKLAQRLWGEKYQVIVATHLDRENHLHSHFVVNTVSFVDGKKYHRTKEDYREMQKVSDALCKEYHLSVIAAPEQGGSKNYGEWRAEQTGQPTMRGMVREDVDRALAKAVNWDTFVIGLKKQGYQIKCGPNVKYAAIRHREGKRWVRLKSLGPEYTEQAIRDRLAQRQVMPFPAPHPAAPRSAPAAGQDAAPVYLPVPRRSSYRCRGRFPLRPKQKITGFMALYYRYLYLLGKAKKRHSSKRTHYLLREDFLKFDRYQAQAKFLWAHNIQSDEDLAAQRESAQNQIAALTTQRKRLYRLRGDSSNCLNKSDLSAQITELTDQLRRLRKTVSLCDAIEADAARLRQQLSEAEQAEREARERSENQRKEKHRYEHWR